MSFNIETSTLIANAFDEYYLYRDIKGRYFIKYTPDFYMRNAKILPEFNIHEMKEFEEISFTEALDYVEEIRNYYGKSSVLIDISKEIKEIQE